MRTKIILSLATLLFASCKAPAPAKSDGKDGAPLPPAPTSAFLTLTDMRPSTNSAALSKDEVLNIILGAPVLYDVEPDEPETPTRQCLNDLLTAKVVATQDKMTFSVVTDIVTCIGKADGFSNIKGSVIFKLFVARSCKGGDLSALNGLTWSQLNEEPNAARTACRDAKSATMIYTSEVISDYAADVFQNGSTHKFVSKSRSIDAVYSGNLRPCLVKKTSDGDWKTSGTCISTKRSINFVSTLDGNAQADQGKETFQQYEGSGLISSIDGSSTWYAGGKHKVRINDWTGTVTHKGSTTPATFKLTANGKTITGKIDDPKPEE